ncbi:MAG: DUF3791 domain-containing protein [Alloprevotella sp.]|nr:DUF3791 domain-containing protein [Alloprevotella sp.]MBR1595011.1 DUF3791 domain-containing protein [Alloprevotella sp.]
MTTTAIPQTQFATLAIGATAQRMGITATELFNRLKRHGLVRRLLFDCYDTLHAESIDGVAWNVQEALKNWELREQRMQSDAGIGSAESQQKKTEGQPEEKGGQR